MSAHVVSLAISIALVLGVRLTLAPGAVAQAPADVDLASVPRRVEAGGTVGTMWVFPTIGVIASLPVTDWLAMEAAVSRVTGFVLSQGQFRVPLGRHQRSRRSLVAGLTHLAGRGNQFTPGLNAHAGVSFQRAVARHFDVRTDLQILMPLQNEPDADPRVALALVWHPRDPGCCPRTSPRRVAISAPADATTVEVDEKPLPRVPPRFEMGVTGGMILSPPTAGGLVGVPLPGGGAVEGTFEGQAPLGDGSRWAFSQAQLRWPIRRSARFRGSVVLGITRATKVVCERATTAIVTPPIEHDWICSAEVCPHGGISLQRLLRGRLDLRLDFQALIAHGGRIPYPRAAVGLVLFRGLR